MRMHNAFDATPAAHKPCTKMEATLALLQEANDELLQMDAEAPAADVVTADQDLQLIETGI